MSQSLRDVFETRLQEFHEGYEWNETDDVIRSLAVAGELLELVFDGDEAAIAMTALRRIIAHGTRGQWSWTVLEKDELDRDWRETWRNIEGWEASSAPAFLDELLALNAFGEFGIGMTWSLAGKDLIQLPEARHLAARLEAMRDMPAWVESVCGKIDRLESLIAGSGLGGKLGSLIATKHLARARIRFDQGMPLTIHELAALSGVSSKRIQNAVYARTDEAPVVDKNGLIGPESCETWLSARDYRPSIWKQVSALYPLQLNWGEDIVYEAAEPHRVIDDYIFVPVANDGTIFAPNLRRAGKGHAGGFTIGPKHSEEVVPTFEEALERLRAMEVPRWRRPNPESGNWGIVSGQSWKRVRIADLPGAQS